MADGTDIHCTKLNNVRGGQEDLTLSPRRG